MLTPPSHFPVIDPPRPASGPSGQVPIPRNGEGQKDRSPRSGFTLVVTLVILAAVTILVLGLYGIVARESQTSASYDAVDQADLAVQSGLDHVGALLKGAMADELGVIFSVPLTPALDEKERPREMLMAANYDVATEQWKYQPLASGVARPPNEDKLKMPQSKFENFPAKDPGVGPSVELNEIEARRLPSASSWLGRVPRYWMQLSLPSEEKKQEQAAQEDIDEEADKNEGKLVARYSFYVEDLQGKLNLANAGMHDSEKDIPYRQTAVMDEVVPEILPNVPGLTIDPSGRWRRNPSSVWTLLRPDLEPLSPEAIPKSMNAMHRRLTAVNSKRLAFSPDMWRELLVTPDPLTNWPGMDPMLLNGPAARLPNGSLANAQLRALEENTTGYLAPYDELALVPHGPGFVYGGERKLNLNRLLADTGGNGGTSNQQDTEKAVYQMAEHIHRHLPEFSKRAGGYPLPHSAEGDRSKNKMAYLKCLAAGMLDYADKDPLPSINVAKGGGGSEAEEAGIEYRGTDAHPLVNEYWTRYRYEAFLGRSVRYSLADFVELWNPTNQEISGQITCCFEYKGRLTAGFTSNYDVMDIVAGRYPENITIESGKPESIEGLQGFWFQPQTITMRPNEYLVLAFKPVTMKIDGAELGNVTSVQYQGQARNDNDDIESRYRLAFKPDGGTAFTVVDVPFLPVERWKKTVTLTKDRQLFNVAQPGLAYRILRSGFAWNVGDTRAAYFIDYNQEEISYRVGSSPWGRNYRRFEEPNTYAMPGESRTLLWPDGGHNSVPCLESIKFVDLDPTDPTVRQRLRPKQNAQDSVAERQKFIQRISNAGRFYSPTEMGNVFDPIMWDPNGKDWYDEKVLYSDHADLKPSVVNINPSAEQLDAHKRFCGGNSLRIGRAEHSLFRPDYRDNPDTGRPVDRGLAASSLLDLFHCGDANSEDPAYFEGPLVRIDGHVNVNTATHETLRALVAGRLVTDPLLKINSDKAEPTATNPVVLLPPSRKHAESQADVIASAIIQNRPYVTPAEVAEKAVLSPADAEAMEKDPELPLLEANAPVFGYTKHDPANDLRVQPEWSDAAAEELFARLWNNSTVRSRHFQVVVTGQAVKIGREGATHVVATRSRLFHVFVRPVRAADGTLQSQVVEITYSRAL